MQALKGIQIPAWPITAHCQALSCEVTEHWVAAIGPMPHAQHRTLLTLPSKSYGAKPTLLNDNTCDALLGCHLKRLPLWLLNSEDFSFSFYL